MICHREYQLDSERGSWRIVGSGLASVTSTNDAKGGWGIAEFSYWFLQVRSFCLEHVGIDPFLPFVIV
jgi:hypothetical protein